MIRDVLFNVSSLKQPCNIRQVAEVFRNTFLVVSVVLSLDSLDSCTLFLHKYSAEDKVNVMSTYCGLHLFEIVVTGIESPSVWSPI